MNRTAKIKIITQNPPLYKYRRFNPLFLRAGIFLDSVIGVFSHRRSEGLIPLNRDEKMLVLESHLIGDGVMTLALINSLKTQKPDLKIILVAQKWMDEILSPGLVDQFIPISLPWVGPGVFSIRKWAMFSAAMLSLRELKPTLAVETRGDWRNFLLFWLMRIPIRLGSPMSGGVVFLTHAMRIIESSEPLRATRESILQFLEIDLPLKLPKPPIDTDATAGNGPYVVIHPGASQQMRQMSRENLDFIVSSIKDSGCHAYVAAGPAESELQKATADFCAKSGVSTSVASGNLKDFLKLCKGAERCFVMDSGPAHLAAWVNQNVTIFCNHDSPNIVAPLVYCL